jgi:hypothetical protein
MYDLELLGIFLLYSSIVLVLLFVLYIPIEVIWGIEDKKIKYFSLIVWLGTIVGGFLIVAGEFIQESFGRLVG